MDNYIKNPNPTKDQHFMKDEVMLQRIYDTADIKEYESICEIGGGEGALTDYLITGNNHVTVIELDPYYANYLKEKYKGNDNVTIVEGNALDFDYSSFDRVVANLPYTITEPFLIQLAKTGALDYNPKNPANGTSNLKSVTLVVSQNSTRKMVAPVQIIESGHKHQNYEYGVIGCICHSFCDVNIECAIPSSAFFPEPAVTSFLVNLTPKEKKTTVDRILCEFLTDRKNDSPTINRLYSLMLARNKIYKVNKHKSNQTDIKLSCTSKVIGDKNIYDLNNCQLSTLVQDLINNDNKMKSSNKVKTRRKYYDEDQLDYYNRTGLYSEDLDDENFEDEDEHVYIKEKYKSNYDYLNESIRYNVLLHRGLEFISEDELMRYLNGEQEVKLEEEIRHEQKNKQRKILKKY